MHPFYSSLSLTNFQHKSDKLALQPITLVTGPIRSNKSRVLNALILSHVGYIPALGKKPGATRQLARTGRDMTVITGLSDKRMIVQTWDKKNAYTVDPVNWAFAPATTLDLCEFLGMTGPARTAHLLDRCGMGMADLDKVFAAVFKELHQTDLPETLKEKTVHDVLAAAFAEVRDIDDLKLSVPAILGAVAENISLKLKLAKATAKGKRETLRQLEVSAATEGLDAPADRTDELVAAQALLVRARQALIEKEATGKAAQKELKPLLTELVAVVDEGKTLKAATECPVCHADGIDWKDKHLAALRVKHTDLTKRAQEVKKQIPDDATLAPLRQEVEQAQLAVATVEQAQKLFHAHKGKDKTLGEIGVQADEADDLALALDWASRVVKAEIAQVTVDSVKTILDRANQLITPVLGLSLDYADAEFGYWRDGQWVSINVMSGSERLLTFAGLQLALTHDAPTRLLLMDELGRVDIEHKVKLVDVLATLIRAGVLHQFVGVDLNADWFRDITSGDESKGNPQFITDNSTLIEIK